MGARTYREFLNVDLILRSAHPVGAVIRMFDDESKLMMLSSHSRPGEHLAAFEVVAMTKTAEATIREIVRAVKDLPRDAAAQWKRAKRSLDIGFQAKGEGAAVVRVTPAMMKAAASIGADIVVTVYPERLLEKSAR